MVSTLSVQTLIALPPIQAEPLRDWKAVLKDEKSWLDSFASANSSTSARLAWYIKFKMQPSRLAVSVIRRQRFNNGCAINLAALCRSGHLH